MGVRFRISSCIVLLLILATPVFADNQKFPSNSELEKYAQTFLKTYQKLAEYYDETDSSFNKYTDYFKLYNDKNYRVVFIKTYPETKENEFVSVFFVSGCDDDFCVVNQLRKDESVMGNMSYHNGGPPKWDICWCCYAIDTGIDMEGNEFADLTVHDKMNNITSNTRHNADSLSECIFRKNELKAMRDKYNSLINSDYAENISCDEHQKLCNEAIELKERYKSSGLYDDYTFSDFEKDLEELNQSILNAVQTPTKTTPSTVTTTPEEKEDNIIGNILKNNIIYSILNFFIVLGFVLGARRINRTNLPDELRFSPHGIYTIHLAIKLSLNPSNYISLGYFIIPAFPIVGAIFYHLIKLK